MKQRVLLTDTIHINRKSFPSLFRVLQNDNRFEVIKVNIGKELISAYGNYHKFPEILDIRASQDNLTEQQLLNLSENRVHILPICEAELLTLLVTMHNFDGRILTHDIEKRFTFYYNNFRDELLFNIAAGTYWIRYWSSKLNSLPLFHCSIVFSGSSIYQKAFIALIKRTQCRNFVIEHSFTGNEFYFEEKYEAIANNSDIKYNTIYMKTLNDIKNNEKSRQRLHIEGINRLFLMSNKNVQQPEVSTTFRIEKRKTILILCQVVNDYSLLEQRIYSIDVYKRILKQLADHKCNVILKLHPWEHKRANLGYAFTKDRMETYINSHLNNSVANILLTENFNIRQLFDKSDFAIGLNSQALIEAAYCGMKPLQFGSAFYGNRGFTYDFAITEIEQAIADILGDRIDGNLSLDEWEAFMDFLGIYTVIQLFGTMKSDDGRILSRLAEK